MKAATRPARQNLQFNWLVVLVLLPLTFLACILLHFNGLYGQEPHEIQRYMLSLFAYLTGGAAPPAQNIPVLSLLEGQFSTY